MTNTCEGIANNYKRMRQARGKTMRSTYPMSRGHARPAQRLLLIAGLALLPLASHAGHNPRKLTAIDAVSLPGNRVEIKLHLNSTAPKPLSFTTTKPARIALDLPHTGIALAKRSQDVDLGPVLNVAAAAAQGRTRVVLDLTTLVPYETRIKGDTVRVILGSGAGTALASAPDVNKTNSGNEAAAATHRITSVDFRRGAKGQGRVLIHLSDPSVAANVQQQGSDVIVDFPHAALPKRLIKRLDVRDFATPVRSIDITRHGDGARLVIHGNGAFEQSAYQANDLFAVELKPLTEAEQAARKQKKYSGKRISLNFQNIKVRAVLQILADASGKNIVVSDSVHGSVTLRLQNVPWDKALAIILDMEGLDTREYGNVILVAPTAEISAHEKLELEAKKQLQNLAPLRSELIQVNYAKASDLAAIIESKGNSLLSKRGHVTVDQRTNTLLIQDTDSHLDDIRRLVAKLDRPVRQVLIESRVVVASNDFTRELGFRMGNTYVNPNSNGLVSVSGSAEGNDTIIGSGISNINSNGNALPVTLPSLDNRLNVNLPVASATGKLALAILSSNYLVDLELSALESEGRGEVVSSPRVITANQKEATIEQGVEIPYQQASSSGATNTQFKKAVLSLRVTPQITPDSNIIMDLEVHKDSLGQALPSATGGQVPSIDTRDVKTQVLVNNGATVVLGGIYENTRMKTVHKIPLLGDIPLLGFLFRDTQNINKKTQLLIFITPKIVSDKLALQ
jgi:type IV pilus assembly protein PilQ